MLRHAPFLYFCRQFLAGLLWTLSLAAPQVSAMELENSRIEFKDWDWNTARPVQEAWDFYWNVILEPSDLRTLADQQLPVGQEWSSLTLSHGQRPTETGTASYRTVLKQLPPGIYDFWLDDIKSSAAVYALRSDRSVIAYQRLGQVSLKPEEAVPARGRLHLSFAVNQGEDVTLLLHISNYVRNRGGHSSSPAMLARSPLFNRVTLGPLVGDIFSLGITFAVGIYCLLIFLQKTSDKAPLYLCLLCLATSSRILGTSQLLYQLFPDKAEALFSFRYTAEYLPMLAASGQLHFLALVLGKKSQTLSRSLRVLDASALILALIILVTPLAVYSRLLAVFEMQLLACCVWFLVFISRGLRRDVQGLSYLIWGSLILAIAVVHDIFVHNMSNLLLAPYGASFFLVLQAQFIAKGLANALQNAEKIGYQLQEKQTEIIRFNSSLEQIIQEKTRDIRSLLENTKVGLFSVNEDLLIHQDYSLCLESILEQRQLKDQSILHLLFMRSDLSVDERDKVLAALRFSFGMERRIFDANMEHLPRKLVLQFSHGAKYLELEWSPLLAANKTVERILISLHDVTSAALLQQEADEGRQQLRILGQIVEIGQQRFERFLKDANQKWELFVHMMRELEFSRKEQGPIIQEMYMRLHTLKATSRLLKLQDLAAAYHATEDLIQLTQDLGPSALIALRHQLTRIRNLQQLYMNALATLNRSHKENYESKALHPPFSIQALLANLEGFASELAHELGKFDCKLDIDISTPILLDEEFFYALSSALVHLVQNSIDHGIEPLQERAKVGKPAYGTIMFFIDDQGRLCMADDGAGLNLSKILESADDNDVLLEDSQSLAEQLFHAGFSTKTEVSQTSGRGIGMNAVRLLLHEVGSRIQIVPIHSQDNFLHFYFAIDLLYPSEQKLPKSA